MAMSNCAKSNIWDHCKVSEGNVAKLVCNYCKREISRGGQAARTFTTSNMLKHLRTLHARQLLEHEDQLEDDPRPVLPHEVETTMDTPDPDLSGPAAGPRSTVLQIQQEVTPGSSRATPASNSTVSRKRPFVQPTVSSLFAKKEKFTKDHPKARRITELVGEMVCLDNLPYSVVEGQGFSRLVTCLEPRYQIPSRKHFSTKIVPDMYTKVRAECEKKISEANWVSFTTDMWSSRANDDFLSLTAHYLDKNFVLQHVFLEVVPFANGSHTAANISDFLKETLETWKLTDKVNIFVRDNGRNFVAAMSHGNFKHIPCLAHTLQLVVKDGCLGNKTVSNVTGNCRRLVGHFKHSCQANKVLRETQTNLGMPIKKLKQDEPTRWDSTFDMLERLKEQRNAISLAATSLNLPVELTSMQWQQINAIVSILAVFKNATLAISSASITVSEVIPIVNSLMYDIRNIQVERSGFQGMKNDLVASLQERFRGFETNPIYSTATILDPRLKEKMFSSPNNSELAKESLIEQLEGLQVHVQRLAPPPMDPSVSGLRPTQPVTSQGGPIWSRYKESKIDESIDTGNAENFDTIRNEVEDFLREPLLENSGNIFHYWETSRFSIIKKLVPKYLGTPPSTVFSERLFSTAGIICSNKRSSMKPENLQKLVFLNKNLSVLEKVST